jgi:hypothetical protein
VIWLQRIIVIKEGNVSSPYFFHSKVTTPVSFSTTLDTPRDSIDHIKISVMQTPYISRNTTYRNAASLAGKVGYGTLISDRLTFQILTCGYIFMITFPLCSN